MARDLYVVALGFSDYPSSLLFQSAQAEDAGNLYNTAVDIRMGNRYFERQCSRCHGFDAKGNDETGAPNLTGRLRRASSDAGIFNIIREGVPGTAMLPVAADVPDATVWQLVAYINSLRYDPLSVELAGDAETGRQAVQRQSRLQRMSYGQWPGRTTRTGSLAHW